MTESERKIMQANIKLQDENNELKNDINTLEITMDKIKNYIKINEEDGKVNAIHILEIIGGE